MISFKKGTRRGQGIILDKPHKGIIGIIECAHEDCAWRAVITIDKIGYEPNGTDYDAEKLADAFGNFLMKHRCCQPPS